MSDWYKEWVMSYYYLLVCVKDLTAEKYSNLPVIIY